MVERFLFVFFIRGEEELELSVESELEESEDESEDSNLCSPAD